MDELPADIRSLKIDSSSPAREFGLTWCPLGSVPTDLVDTEHQSPAERAGWASMLRELSFVASEEYGSWLALWRHAPGVTLEQAPVVELDTEGQLSCVAAKLADWFILQAEQLQAVRGWFLDRGVDVARDPDDVYARCRYAPDPQGRLERLQGGLPMEVASRDLKPLSPEDLLGMHGQDARAQAYVASIERADQPLELSCDFAGRIDTLWLKPERLAAPLALRGVTVGGPVDSLAALGSPSRSGEGWCRWDVSDVAIHVEQTHGRVTQVTLMYRPSLPSHLR